MIKSGVGKWGLQRGKGRLIFFICCMFTLFVCGSAGAFKLPDTGQTACYDTNGNIISCAGTGQDGEYNINPLSYTDNGNGTVTDNNTGLMWQQEDDGNIYNWYVASGTYDATYNPTSQDVCGALNLGGHSDWRLPAKKELMTIVDYGIPYPGPTIDTTYFPNTKSVYYWTSTSFVGGLPTFAFSASFGDSIVSYVNKPWSGYVRCVRGEQIPGPNLIDNGDGTVTDNKTSLMWQQGEPGYMTWDSALSYCKGLSLGNHSDWRLPNIKELESITDDTWWNPAIDTTYFPSAHSLYYWSSTTDAYSPSYAWYVYFYSGYAAYADFYKDNYLYVRCVRGGLISTPDISVMPISYDFGSVTVGSSSTPQTFTISNTDTADLHISGMTLSDITNYSLNVNGGSSPCGSTTPTITPNSTCMVTVTFSPSSTGTIDRSLAINSDDPDTPTLNVSLSGTGVIPLVECHLVPDATSIHRGGTLGFWASAQNNEGTTQNFKFVTKVKLPNGSMYPPSGWLLGPITVTLGPHTSKSKYLTQFIPYNAPFGTYTYYGYIGTAGPPVIKYGECQFTFTVTTQGQGCTLCHQ